MCSWRQSFSWDVLISVLGFWFINFSLVFFFYFSALTVTCQILTRRFCFHVSGLKVRGFTWNGFRIKIILIDSLFTHCGEYLLEYKYVQVWIIAKRWKPSTVGWSSKAYRKPRVCICCFLQLTSVMKFTFIFKSVAKKRDNQTTSSCFSRRSFMPYAKLTIHTFLRRRDTSQQNA